VPLSFRLFWESKALALDFFFREDNVPKAEALDSRISTGEDNVPKAEALDSRISTLNGVVA